MDAAIPALPADVVVSRQDRGDHGDRAEGHEDHGKDQKDQGAGQEDLGDREHADLGDPADVNWTFLPTAV